MITKSPSATLNLSALRTANEAVVLENFTIDLTLSTPEPIAEGPFKGLPQVVGEGISFRGTGGVENRVYPTRIEVRAVESSKNLLEEDEDAEDLIGFIGQRVTTVHSVLFGRKMIPDPDAKVGKPKMILSPDEVELQTMRTGLSFNKNSANPNMRSVSFMRKNTNLFIPPGDKAAAAEAADSESKASATSEVGKRVLNAFNAIERAVRDSFEGIDLKRFEQGGDLAHLSKEVKDEFRAYDTAVRKVAAHLKNWKRPSTDAKPSVTNTPAQAKVEKTEPMSIDDLEAEVKSS